MTCWARITGSASAIFPAIWTIESIRAMHKRVGKDREELKSYAPLCLLPLPGKVLERLILNGLNSIINDGPSIAQRQFGFRAGIVRIVRTNQEPYVLAIAFDIEGAFGNLCWPAVLEELKRRKCVSALYGLVYSFLPQDNYGGQFR